jgi:hypothetical protein
MLSRLRRRHYPVFPVYAFAHRIFRHFLVLICNICIEKHMHPRPRVGSLHQRHSNRTPAPQVLQISPSTKNPEGIQADDSVVAKCQRIRRPSRQCLFHHPSRSRKRLHTPHEPSQPRSRDLYSSLLAHYRHHPHVPVIDGVKTSYKINNA